MQTASERWASRDTRAHPRPLEPASRCRVLVVDDEPTVVHVIQQVLQEHGCEVAAAASVEAAVRELEQRAADVALVDIVLPGRNGLELLGEIKQQWPETEVLMMTSQASVDTAVRAIREGAYDYLEKPFADLDQVWHTVQRALERRTLSLDNRALLEEQERRNRELSSAVARLTSLVEAGRAMGEFDSLDRLLEFFLELVTRELDVERASIMLTDRDLGELRIAAHRGIHSVPVQEVRIRLGEGVAGRVAQSGRACLVTDLRSDPRLGASRNPDLSNSFISAPIVLSVPIKSKQTVLGVINVTNRRSREPFTEDDLSYLSGLAGQAAVAIERTAHFDKLQRAYESLKEAEGHLVRSERLKALGELAAGVAHDFNNSLSVILGRTEVILRHLDGDPASLGKVRAGLETVRRVALQATETIRRIRAYTRIRPDTPEEAVDLNAVVRDVVEMTRPKWEGEHRSQGCRIAVETELADVPPVPGNAYELSQVVGNLLFNAVEAMPRGGRMRFGTFVRDGRVNLEVSDTGEGMDEETRRRLFEPFFTTKDSGHGLGMSIVYGILTRHRAQITVESEVGAGSTFRISFPRFESARPVAGEKAEPTGEPGRGARVLLFEEDDEVRETYHEALVSGGHEVVAVAEGAEALAAIGADPFDVVLTDVGTARPTGFDLAREVKKSSPETPVILLNAWAAQQDGGQIRGAGVDYVLAKPCLVERLLHTVQLAIRSGSGGRGGRLR